MGNIEDGEVAPSTLVRIVEYAGSAHQAGPYSAVIPSCFVGCTMDWACTTESSEVPLEPYLQSDLSRPTALCKPKDHARGATFDPLQNNELEL